MSALNIKLSEIAHGIKVFLMHNLVQKKYSNRFDLILLTWSY